MRELRTIEDGRGRKIGEVEYLDGKPHGLTRIWTPAGVLTQEAELEFGEYHGKYCTWWDNGKKKEKGRFSQGRRFGLYRWYSECGKLIKEEDYGPGVL